jgi:hypothetical protein
MHALSSLAMVGLSVWVLAEGKGHCEKTDGGEGGSGGLMVGAYKPQFRRSEICWADSNDELSSPHPGHTVALGDASEYVHSESDEFRCQARTHCPSLYYDQAYFLLL